LITQRRKLNADSLKGATWSQRDRCLQLSYEQSLEAHRIVAMIEGAGLTVRFYGRLKGWDGKSLASRSPSTF
jgi:hypothetical protein